MIPTLESVFRKVAVVTVVVAIGLNFMATAAAATLFQQSAVSGGEGVLANAAAGAQNADSFALANPVSIATIGWSGSYDGIASDNFSVRIYADAAGNPGAALLSLNGVPVAKTDAGFNDTAGAPVSHYVATLANPLTLGPGTYYLAVTNETQTANWYWLAGNGANSAHWHRVGDADNWNVSSTAISLAFALNDAPFMVPLPLIALIALAFGMAGVAMGIPKRAETDDRERRQSR